tara:strand:- start:142 stop:1125 length:984 start_codon:yes stop_codon:yes gene_type:complete
MKKILVTFDYELFLGPNSGSVINCIIKPTELVLDVLEKHSIKAIFFIDTTYIFHLKKIINKYPKAKYDYEMILDQLHKINLNGHYLFHHLHPHWYDAKYNSTKNTWDLSNHKRYNLHQINSNLQQELIEFSNSFLNSIIDIKQKFSGFRFGGLQSSKFEVVLDFLKKYNIKYEFSIVKNYQLKDYYMFSTNPRTIDENGFFKEFTITTFNIRFLNRILNSLNYRSNKSKSFNNIFGDGVGKHYNSESNNPHSFLKRIKSKFLMKMLHSIEILNPVTNKIIINQLKKQDYIHFLSHPKLISKYSVQQFDTLITNTKKAHKVEFNFKNF